MSLHRITDGDRLLGYIAIDSTIHGRARGGLRLVRDLSEAEIVAAAHSMTLKYGLLGFPQGGAKAGVIGEGEAPAADREHTLRAFAHAAAPLLRSRLYVPDADIGTTATEIRTMMRSIGAAVASREWLANNSGDYTARSALGAARAMLERRRITLRGCRVAVEGFGKVGSVLARLLHERGATVIAISTSAGALSDPRGLDVLRLARRAADLGSTIVEHEPGRLERSALLELPVDLLCPCARFESIHASNAGAIAAFIISPGANNALNPETERALIDRGVAIAPDFVSNSGGVLGGTLEFAGVAPDRIAALVEERVRRYMLRLMDVSERTGRPLRSLAEEEAFARHDAVRRATEHPTTLQRVTGIGIEAFRRGLIPSRLMGVVAERYVPRWLA